MSNIPQKRVLPRLMACMTKSSLENLRNKALFGLTILDAKAIRRKKMPVHNCLILELKESGFVDSSNYLIDLIYDNQQLMAQDEIGIVIDLRTKPDIVEHIASGLQKAERERDKGNTKNECKQFLSLALFYSEQGKGILWLAEKFFMAAVAVSSQFFLDGGAQKARCKYYYSKYLLDKYSDPEEPYQILTTVREVSIGKDWLLDEDSANNVDSPVTVFNATAVQLHRVLLEKSRRIRKKDTGKSERLARLAERRARDAGQEGKMAEAIIEIGICQLMMNNLNNAQKTLERAFKIHSKSNNIAGICETKMHMAAVVQKLGDHESAARLLTEMGALAMNEGLRRQLGRALHLLGELQLRRERPELGTHHLAEAFSCFMGIGFFSKVNDEQRFCLEKGATKESEPGNASSDLHSIMNAESVEVFVEEAEQSRLMMAISAGQQLMASYFDMLREAHVCNVAQMKTMEWKLNRAGWWVKRAHHDFLPCMCPAHRRTPLDCLQISLEFKAKSKTQSDIAYTIATEDLLKSTGNFSDMTKLHSMSPNAFVK